MNHVTHPLSSAGITIFSPKIDKFFYIKKYRYRFHFDTLSLILSNFFESLKIVIVHIATISMMSEKIATLGLLEKSYFEITVMAS